MFQEFCFYAMYTLLYFIAGIVAACNGYLSGAVAATAVSADIWRMRAAQCLIVAFIMTTMTYVLLNQISVLFVGIIDPVLNTERTRAQVVRI